MITPNPAGGKNEHIDRRKAGRLRCSGLVCSLGEVADLCASGMRVRSTRPIALATGGDITLTADDLTLTLKGRIAWSRQMGRKSYEAGLEFVGLDGEQRKTLAEIARLTSSAFAAMYYTNAA
jgi:hypothetical protein